jgi:MFS family permease
MKADEFQKDWQYYKFCLYGFLKNQRFFEFFLLLIFYQYKELNFAQIGVLYSIRLIFRAVLEIPSGFLADILGRKGVMLFAYAMYMFSFIGYHLADTFGWLIIPSVIFGIGDAFRTGTHKAMIFEYLKRNGWTDQKVAYYGHTRSWSQFGSAISSLIGAALVLIGGGYQYIFLFSLMPYTLGFVLLASYPAYLNGQANMNDSSGIKNRIRSVFITATRSFRKSANIRIAFNVSSFSGFYQASKDYLQIIISSFALSVPLVWNLKKSEDEKEIVLIGAVYFILFFLTAAASRNTAKISRLFTSVGHYLNVLLLVGITLGIIAGILYTISAFAVSLILFVLIFMIENLRRPAGIAEIAGQFDESILASVLSIESQLSSIIGAIMSLVIGFLADKLDPGIALATVSIFVLLAYPLLRILKPR